MAKNGRAKQALDAARGGSKLKKDPGVPKLIALKRRVRNHDPKYTNNATNADPDTSMRPPPPPSATIASLAYSTTDDMVDDDLGEGPSNKILRDNTVAAHAHQFKKVLELSDVIIQVLDARDPMGCRSKAVEEEVKRAGGDKMMILALNKTDLVPKDNVLAWLRYLRHDYPTVPLKSSTSNAKHQPRPSASSEKGQGAPHLLTLLKSYRRAHTSLTVGVVGPPNVGKSSLINALKRLRGGEKDVVTVGAKPGETRAIKEVGLEKGLKVLDMPGIVWGDFLGDDLPEAEGVTRPAGVGSLNMVGVEYLEDPVGAVEAIVSRVPAETLQGLYNVPAFANSIEFLTMVALSRGRLIKGGAPDQAAAARSVLNDWNAGTIPYHTVPPKIHTSSIPSVPRIPDGTIVHVASGTDDTSIVKSAADVGAAQFMTKFSEPFDLEGLFSLTDKDVLDNEDTPYVEDAPMEDIDEDVAPSAFVPESEPADNSPSRNKRARSPTASIATTQGQAYESDRRVKLPRPKRVRYNPNAPIVHDAMEIASMSALNPLSRKRQREDAKKKKRGGAGDEIVMDDIELALEAELEKERFTFKPSGGAFAMLAEAEVPLPDEDENEEL